MRAARFTNHSRPGICYTSNRAFLENSDEDGGNFSVKRPSEHRPVTLMWSTTEGRRGLHTLWPPLAENVATNPLPHYYSRGLTLPIINIIVNINRNVNMTITLNRNRNAYDWVVSLAFSALFIVCTTVPISCALLLIHWCCSLLLLTLENDCTFLFICIVTTIFVD